MISGVAGIYPYSDIVCGQLNKGTFLCLWISSLYYTIYGQPLIKKVSLNIQFVMIEIKSKSGSNLL